MLKNFTKTYELSTVQKQFVPNTETVNSYLVCGLLVLIIILTLILRFFLTLNHQISNLSIFDQSMTKVDNQVMIISLRKTNLNNQKSAIELNLIIDTSKFKKQNNQVKLEMA